MPNLLVISHSRSGHVVFENDGRYPLWNGTGIDKKNLEEYKEGRYGEKLIIVIIAV